jgi:ribose 5-phosphate isomerase B
VKVAVGFDHGGFNLKRNICEMIKRGGHEIIDVGAYCLDLNDDYPDFAIKVALEVSSSHTTKGIVVCEEDTSNATLIAKSG